ncbi:MAG: tRNA uridine-5-carboxymethylaminomethyl(34) synthesis GTPase MnmE [Clostridia bacterium]|nr:tRNA uridine-5-carboxymethylaminomethyl(34) synthesis GTPase MnmE [Clostridia bacterium]
MILGDTIAALSTPRGKGGVALIRISGQDARVICDRIFRPKSGKSFLQYAPPRTALYGGLLAPDANGEFLPVDDGLVTFFPGPASFTGEDTVEICCHGGVLLTQTVLTAVYAAGARPAEAGEFTRRAFLNGKMGLSSAEALGNMLEAQTREQLTLAHTGMGGKVEGRCEEIYQSLCAILASIYAKIDYPDEDLADMSREEMLQALEGCESSLASLVRTYHTGHAIAEGIPTVICGKPNAGKSSLYNRILGKDAAIVTDVEGTTRDILSEIASLGRVTLRLFDTAGLRETDNPVEQIGIARAREALRSAELVLAVFDVSRPADDQDRELIQTLSQLENTTVVAVLNKSDLCPGEPEETYTSAFSHTVLLSAKSGEGMAALEALVERLFTDGALDLRQDAVLTNARQHAAGVAALEAVRRAILALRSGVPMDLCCTDAEQAMSALCELDGRSVSEDIVTRIFSHFCVGK